MIAFMPGEGLSTRVATQTRGLFDITLHIIVVSDLLCLDLSYSPSSISSWEVEFISRWIEFVDAG